jgi:hypothetical protein
MDTPSRAAEGDPGARANGRSRVPVGRNRHKPTGLEKYTRGYSLNRRLDTIDATGTESIKWRKAAEVPTVSAEPGLHPFGRANESAQPIPQCGQLVQALAAPVSLRCVARDPSVNRARMYLHSQR